MRKLIYPMYVIGGLFLFCLGCKEDEMIKFEMTPAINFAAFDITGDASAEAGLKQSYDFTRRLETWLPVQDIYARIQGEAQIKDLKAVFKVLPVEGYRTPGIIFTEEFVIKAGEFTKSVRLELTRPELADTVYKADLVIDYENSDFIPGVKERQTFRVEVVDHFIFTWEAMGIPATYWEKNVAPVLGKPSAVKVHFILDVLDLSDLSEEAPYLTEYADIFRGELKKYNDKHPDRPLRDENGELVSFEP